MLFKSTHNRLTFYQATVVLMITATGFKTSLATSLSSRLVKTQPTALRATGTDTTTDGPTVTIFYPGEIPGTAPRSAAPAFSHEGNRVWLGQSTKNGIIHIVFSEKHSGKWSQPVPAAFSDKYRDLEPAFSPDGKYLIFASSRPAAADGAELDGHYNGKVFNKSGGNLWKVRVNSTGTGKPQRLPDEINSNSAVFSPAITADGSLYFMRADSGGIFHIYRSQMRNGMYQTPVKAVFSLPDVGDYDPVVAPDESFLIFSSGRVPAPRTTDLFIIFRTGDGWSQPLDLRTVLSADVHGVEARLSPDRRVLYFSNSVNPAGQSVPDEQYIWKINIASFLKAHGIRQ